VLDHAVGWLLHDNGQHLIALYGYWVVATIVALESVGLPLPGETTLIAAAIYAGSTHKLSIAFVILAAFVGAVVGDSIGFWIGREVGFPVVVRYGRYIHLTERRIKLGQYIFRQHGGKVVFFGRFVAVLRALAALLAGVGRMAWPRFLMFNVSGGAVWATLYGLAAYILGDTINQLSAPVGLTIFAIAAIAVAVGSIIVWRNRARLEVEAEQKFPGPLQPGNR
jgi:membrane protein DedA with SNARE-associated domain